MANPKTETLPFDDGSAHLPDDVSGLARAVAGDPQAYYVLLEPALRKLEEKGNSGELIHAFLSALISGLDAQQRSLDALQVIETLILRDNSRAKWEGFPGVLAFNAVLSLVDYYNGLVDRKAPVEKLRAIREKMKDRVKFFMEHGNDFNYGEMQFVLPDGKPNEGGGNYFWRSVYDAIRGKSAYIEYPTVGGIAERQIERHVRNRVREGNVMPFEPKRK